MLYSIFPPEVIFPDSSTMKTAGWVSLESSWSSTAQEHLVEIERGSARVIVARTGEGRARVVRLISTDPFDYLDPRFSPGADIRI